MTHTATHWHVSSLCVHKTCHNKAYSSVYTICFVVVVVVFTASPAWLFIYNYCLFLLLWPQCVTCAVIIKLQLIITSTDQQFSRSYSIFFSFLKTSSHLVVWFPLVTACRWTPSTASWDSDSDADFITQTHRDTVTCTQTVTDKTE